MNKEHSDYYRKLRSRVSGFLSSGPGSRHPWAGMLLLAPDLFYLLAMLVKDPRVAAKQKLKLAAALAYFIAPFEILPEAVLGPIGLLDDVAFGAFALHGVINEIDPAIVREHWTGQDDALETIQGVLDKSRRMLGSGVWGKLIRRFGGRAS